MNAKIVNHLGYTCLSIDGARVSPAASRSFRPQGHIVGDFARQGFQLFNVFPSGIMCALANRTIPYSQFGEVWTGPGRYDWDRLRAQVDLFRENAPDGYVSVMAQLDPPNWYLASHPGCADSWSELVQVAGDPTWRADAKEWLLALVDQMDELMPGRVYGVFLLCGGTTEWYTRDVEAGIVPTEMQTRAYRAYMGDETARVPAPEILHRTTDGCLRDPSRDADALSYWHFLNDCVTDAILYFARAVKEHTRGNKAVGIFSGYTHGMSLERVMTSSYSEIARLLNADDIDCFFCPASYAYRKLASTSGFRVPVDSYRLHKKLYFHELDSRTHLTQRHPIGQLHAAGADEHFTNFPDARAYFRREVGMVLCKGQGYWWFDMFAGWFDDAEMMEEIGRLRRLTDEAAEAGVTPVSQVCELVDTASTYYLDTKTHYCLQESQSLPLNRAGVPWDSYLSTDLLNPEMDVSRYRLFIFPALIAPSEALIQKIEELRALGKSFLFLHAPGYIAPDGFSVGQMERLTRIPLKKRTEGGEISFVTGEKADFETLPAFEALAGEPLARYADGKTAACALDRADGGFDAYCACGPAPEAFLRLLYRRAGVSAYLDTGDPVYACREWVTVFTREAGERRLRVPGARALTDAFTNEIFREEGGAFRVPFGANDTRILRVQEN